jgi:Flp pilus assembly secretin CpaC
MRTGETALLVSSLSRAESDSITGLPGVSEIPGFQSTTNKNSNLNVAELAIVITPHVVRSVHREASEKMIMLPGGP